MTRRLLLTMSALVALCTTAAMTDGTAAITGFDPDSLDDVPRLTVRGNAVLYKPADQLRLRIGVVTEAAEATSAVADNSRRMTAVVAAIKKTGLGESEYQTGRFSIRPKYSRRPRQADPGWTRQIIGYEVNNTLSIRTKKLDLAGKLIEATNAAGANSIDAITFDLANPRTHRAEAIAAAAVNARFDAGILARASEVTLVRIISVQLDDSGHRPPVMMAARTGALAAGVAAPTPPIQPGDVTVQASVTIVYEIAPRE